MFHPLSHPGSYTRFQEPKKNHFTDSLHRTGRDYHVLVVHSGPQFLNLMAAMFLKIGYRVTTAGDSATALAHFGRNPCDLLFTDLEVSVLDGYHLACLVKKQRPQAKAVAMTCCCQAEVVHLMGDGVIDGWLFKPFKMNELTDTLADIDLPVSSPHLPKQGEERSWERMFGI